MSEKFRKISDNESNKPKCIDCACFLQEEENSYCGRMGHQLFYPDIYVSCNCDFFEDWRKARIARNNDIR